MKKVYLAHPISTTGEFNDSIRVAERIKDIYRTKEITTEEDDVMGTVNEPKYDVYAPALNKAINDKSNNPTPQMIYRQDVKNLIKSDVVVMNYTGGDSDGTVLEIGLLGGLLEGLRFIVNASISITNNDEYTGGIKSYIQRHFGEAVMTSMVKEVQKKIFNEITKEYRKMLPKVFVYSSNQRATKPQLYNLALKKLYEAGVDESLEGFIPSGKLNAMVIGLIEEYFVWCANEDEVIQKLRDYDG